MLWPRVVVILVALSLRGSHLSGAETAEPPAGADRPPLAGELPIMHRTEEYASAASCRECHPERYASWTRTYHRSMTQAALPGNVLGEFPAQSDGGQSANAATIDSNGLSYSVYRQGDAFFAEMPDPEMMMYAVQGGRRTGEFTYLIKPSPTAAVEAVDLRTNRVTRPVVMTTGSHRYQTYWVPGDDKYGRLLQTLPLVWLKQDRRWIPREAAFMQPPGVRMITQWNHHCIRCHSTGGVPGLVVARDAAGNYAGESFQTRVADLGIACEACHGPGLAHVEAQRDLRTDATIVNPETLDHERATQVCGQCHGVFIDKEQFALAYASEGAAYRPGDDLNDSRYYVLHPRSAPSRERWEEFQKQPQFYRQRWWEDGTILAGGREYTAMVVSPCYTRGEISCLSCHSMHHSDPNDQLKPQMDTSRACTQCHQDAQFTTDVASHTHHAAGSTGSNCLNCHMPHTTYALFTAIRSHQIGSPRLSSAVEHGVPHACNLCHLDKTLDWTQEHLIDWYDHTPIALSDDQREVSAALLWLLKGHAAQRAIAAWHFGWAAAQAGDASGSDWQAPFLAQLLADPYGVVRYVAKESLKTLPGFEDFEYDFLADEATRERNRDAAVKRWRQWTHRGGAPPQRTGLEVLLDDEGTLLENRLRQLLQDRDDTPITIKE